MNESLYQNILHPTKIALGGILFHLQGMNNNSVLKLNLRFRQYLFMQFWIPFTTKGL